MGGAYALKLVSVRRSMATGCLPERLEHQAELVNPLGVNLISIRDVEGDKRIIALGTMKIPLNRGVFI